MKLKQLIYKLTYPTMTAATAALLCMGVCGCSSDSPIDDGDVAEVPDKDMWLNLHLSVPSPTAGLGSSRADDAAGHPEEADNYDESYIDCTGSNLSLMFFDNQQRLMRVLTPQEMTVTPGAGEGMYDLHFRLNSDYFDYAGTADNIECTYMLVANINGTGSSSGSTFSTEALFAKTPANIADLRTSFGMPDQSSAAWMPSAADKQLIPMAGIARGRISRTDLDNSTAETAADLGTLSMQRALVKIRVLDAIPLQTDTDMDHITAVTIQGCNTRGAYIPAGTTAWYNGTTDVEIATEMTEWYAPDGRIKMLNTPQTSTVENKTYQNAFVCYVPECALLGKEAKMIITVAEKESGVTQDFEINLKESYGDFGGLSALARNHIYEFEVKMSTVSQLHLKYTVCDWDQYTVNPPTFE